MFYLLSNISVRALVPLTARQKPFTRVFSYRRRRLGSHQRNARAFSHYARTNLTLLHTVEAINSSLTACSLSPF